MMIDVNRKTVLIAGLLLLITSASTGSTSLWLYGKATLAQILLERAWQQSIENDIQVRPWPWADMHTVARLSLPQTRESLIVLSDTSGESMAFGPGLIAGELDQANNSALAIGGHRDSHLAFLEHLQTNDRIDLQTADGNTIHYRLVDKQVVDSTTHEVQMAVGYPGLVLVTCYPFHAFQTGGPLRMVAQAVRVDPGTGSST